VIRFAELYHPGEVPGSADRLRTWRLPARLVDAVGPLSAGLCQAGLITGKGYDAYLLRIVFPLEDNHYGVAFRLRRHHAGSYRGGKGGLYAWARVRQYPEVILVEGLFDCAVLWEAGFRNVTCSLGTHLNARQLQQLCDATRIVYLA
jgi:DNA primase